MNRRSERSLMQAAEHELEGGSTTQRSNALGEAEREGERGAGDEDRDRAPVLPDRNSGQI